MLLKKNIFFKYKSVLSLHSFNKNSLNNYIWNIRKNLLYMFFFLYKKNYLIKFYFSYYIIIFLFRLHFMSNKYLISLNSFFYIHVFKFFFSFYNNVFSSIFYSNIFYFKHISGIYNYINYLHFFKINVIFSLFFKYICNLFYVYNNYNFILFVWLFTLKNINFFNINVSNLPLKKKKFVVLKSPHTNKKAREKFHVRKIKKVLCYPSLLNSKSNFFFINFINENILIKNYNNCKIF